MTWYCGSLRQSIIHLFIDESYDNKEPDEADSIIELNGDE